MYSSAVSSILWRCSMGKVVSNGSCIYSWSKWWVRYSKFWKVWRGIWIFQIFFIFFFVLLFIQGHSAWLSYLPFTLFHLQADCQTHSSSRAGPWRKVILGFLFLCWKFPYNLFLHNYSWHASLLKISDMTWMHFFLNIWKLQVVALPGVCICWGF